MDPSWLLYLSIAHKRLDPLFPSLKELTLVSGDKLSLFIALATCTVIQALSIDLGNTRGDPAHEEAIVALTASLRRTPGTLTRLRILHPVNHSIIDNICNIPSLRLLILHAPNVDDTMLKSLSGIPVQNLELDSAPFECAEIRPTIQTLGALYTRQSNPALRSLLMRGNGNAQHAVASVVCPRLLTHLTLRVLCCGDYRQRRLVPFIAAVHLGRNTSLTSVIIELWLEASWSSSYQHEPASEEWDRRFLSSLSALLCLSILTITYASFTTPTIICDLLEAVKDMKSLSKLHLLPRPDGFPLTYPSLSMLETIASRHPDLKELAICIDCTVPFDRPGASVHGLISIALDPPYSASSDPIQFSVNYLLALSRYLDSLFPQLKSTTGNLMAASLPVYGQDISMRWADVEQLVFSHQAIRAETIDSMQKQRVNDTD